jgi:hypothetical protein
MTKQNQLEGADASFATMVATGQMILVIGSLTDTRTEIDADRPASLKAVSDQLVGVGAGNVDLTTALPYARQAKPDATNRLLEDLLTVKGEPPAYLGDLLAGPWERIYDLTGSDLLKVSGKAAGRNVVFSDATIEFSHSPDRNQVVHLCGEPNRAQEIDFSPPSGSSHSTRYSWFSQFAADLATRPVLVVCAQPHRELWDFLKAGRLSPESVRWREGFILSDSLEVSDVMRAANASLSVLSGPVESFVADRLKSNFEHVSRGHRSLARLRAEVTDRGGVQLASKLIRQSVQDGRDDWEFLRGNDPSWSDVVGDRVARLSRMKELHKSIVLDHGHRNVVVVVGRAGSGKTALLMRLAAELSQKGNVVAWLDREATDRLANLLDEVAEIAPDIALIDDVDMFGLEAAQAVRRTNQNGATCVVVSVRTTKSETLKVLSQYETVNCDAELTDRDLVALLAKLDAAGLLGILKGIHSDEARLEKLRKISGRDLLGGLMEIVTGQPFEKRIESEFVNLPLDERSAYSLVCVYASHVFESVHLPENDLVQMIGSRPPYSEQIRIIDSLLEKRLIVREKSGIRARHRAIADVVIKSLDDQEIGQIVSMMLAVYVPKAVNISDPSHPDRRNMIALLNHRLMVRVRLRPSTVRGIYSNFQQTLGDDFHFWLQRGAFEVEKGDIEFADSYLESARGCPGGVDDYQVVTEWGRVKLIKARREPNNHKVQERALGAMAELMRVMKTKGKRSPHTFAITVKDGVAWMRSNPAVSKDLRIGVIQDIYKALELGESLCSDNEVFMRIARDSRPLIEKLSRPDSPPFPLG